MQFRPLIPSLRVYVAAVCAVIALHLPPPTAARAESVSSGPRMTVDMDSSWRFLRADVPGAEQPAFDDSAWQPISVPHTWNAADGADGPQTPYYRGVGWYRRHLRLDGSPRGKSLFLYFDGAATVADVFVNGKSAGEHRGNFAAFCFDVTALLTPGGDNVIAVKVDNAHMADVAPLSGDFTIYGGLYRDVRLLALDPLSITPLDSAGPGVYVKQAQVTGSSAALEITTKMQNAGASSRRATVRCHITDARGATVAQASADSSVGAGANGDAVEKLSIPSPHLWDGVNDPYLYHVSVEIYDGKRLTDRVVQPLGIRYFNVDPNQGLLLNGRHYALHGVNRHQDVQGKGWAISAADHERDYRLIREMGSTGIRLSHYQHAQAFYDLCDSGGLVVWAELPLVNQLGHTPAFDANARQQLTELIKQNYNHPSILFWSLFNELGFRNTADAHQWDLIPDLNALAHQLDSTRLTTAASSAGITHPINFITDIIAFNRYPGWYGGKPTDWSRLLDEMHTKYPDRCIAISEYGAGASAIQHEEYPPAQPKASGKWHPEEWQSLVHKDSYQAMASRPWLWGTFLWCMYDFGSDGRNEGDTPGRNDKGMMTYDRATKKDAYYWYAANWNSAETVPFVHINSAGFSPRPARASTIRVYSNCETVNLVVNGVDMGAKSEPGHIFVWENVALNIGVNAIKATSTHKGKSVSDECSWTGIVPPPPPPAQLLPANAPGVAPAKT